MNLLKIRHLLNTGSNMSSAPQRILILYTELAGYVLAGIAALRKSTTAEIIVVHFPVNPEAPFQFQFPEGVEFRCRDTFADTQALTQFAQEFSPQLVFCCGWIDKAYLAVCRLFKPKVPVVVGFDNWWRGDIRQWLAVLSAPFTIRPYFTHAWVPGKPQTQFAKRLGFRGNRLLTGYYTADTDQFYTQYTTNRTVKSKHFPQRFIYVGRYYAFKGLGDLWEGFKKFRAAGHTNWELWCYGTGDMTPIVAEGIRHFGFVQPDEMKTPIRETGVFILPSRREPWGVVVHEFAAAGFPLLCSSEVGAATQFVKSGENGFLFTAGNADAIAEALKKIAELTPQQLVEMGDKSAELALENTPQHWANTLLSAYNS